MIKRRRSVVDWFMLLVELKKQGYSHHKIFNHTKIPVGTLAGFKQGSEPKHGDGERLISLWCKVTGKNREFVPRVTRYSNHF